MATVTKKSAKDRVPNCVGVGYSDLKIWIDFYNDEELIKFYGKVMLMMDANGGDSEFLKGATVRPYGRAIFFRDCAKFVFLNAKLHNLSLCLGVFCLILFAQNFPTNILVAQKK